MWMRTTRPGTRSISRSCGLCGRPELRSQPGVTAIVGENGSGKSTLVEAMAVALRLNPEGGSRSLRFSTRATESGLGEYARAVRAPGRERRSFFLRAESFYNVAPR